MTGGAACSTSWATTPSPSGCFHHDPGVLLYAPLRTTIYEDARGVTRFAIDQPSAQFASFGDPEIAAVGVALDRKVAALLAHLGVPVPERLTGDRS